MSTPDTGDPAEESPGDRSQADGDDGAVGLAVVPEKGVVAETGGERVPGEGDADRSSPLVPGTSDGSPEFRMVIVSSVTLDLPSQHPTVTLRELELPGRSLTFSVGLHDGTVLSHALRRIPTPRPLVHELLGSVIQGFDIDLVAVRLVGRQGALYFAELDLQGRTGRRVYSCRPSDGLTLAISQPISVPILVDARLLSSDADLLP